MRENGSTRPPSIMSSVTSALRVLDLVEDGVSLRVVDVSRRLDLPNSTAHRILNTLREHGYLRQQAGSSRYEAGPGVLRLARRVNTEQALERIAMPHLHALRQEVNETVNLQVLVGNEVLFIASVEDHHQLRVAQRAGTRSPAYANAGGKLLLALLTDDEVRTLVRDDFKALTSHTIQSTERLIGDLKEIRRQSYAVNISETDEGVHAVAVGISDDDGTTIAALSLAAPAIRLPMARIALVLPHMRSAAAAVASDYRGH
jgi:DNA-binding IclR family transcriptional regulator